MNGGVCQRAHRRRPVRRRCVCPGDRVVAAEGDILTPRPKPIGSPDDLLGHVLSLRAEQRQTHLMLTVFAIAMEGDELADELTELREWRA